MEVLTSTRKRAAPDDHESNDVFSSTRNPGALQHSEPNTNLAEITLPTSSNTVDTISAEGSATADNKRQKLLEAHSAEDIELALKFLAQAKQ